MSIGMELRLRQHLAITPQIQQALRLLQLSSLEFAQEVEEACSTNPFLEEDTEAVNARPALPDLVAPPTTDAPSSEADDGAPLAGVHDEFRSAPARDDENDWTEWTEAPTSLRENLREQLRVSPMGDRDRVLAQMIIDELSEAGYLETPLTDLLELIAPEEEVEEREMLAALRLVQHLDPPGIGARTLQECLMLQLEALPEDTEGRDVALAIVSEHLELLGRREFTHIQQLVGCTETELHTARALIRTLDPRPGRGFAPDNTRYVVPDIIVSQHRGKWVATLNPAVQPQVRINRAYADIAAGRSGCDASFTRLLQEARWLLRNVEQRFSTIQRVADAIVHHQRVFFSYGEVAMKPLALKDIASELGLHESTVCRVTNGKYMATPRGLFEFKYFFSRQLATDDGGSCSALAIRALMKELISAEDPKSPLSDAELARLLGDQGLRLARRTVTKYRSLMRVPSVELRRVATRPLAPSSASAVAHA
jgi:RNA polymerase sigma-54 factor